MLPDLDDYRAYGERLGSEITVRDWEGFTQMKRWDHGFLPKLREIAGYDDPMGVGTYASCPHRYCREAYHAMIDGFRDGATSS